MTHDIRPDHWLQQNKKQQHKKETRVETRSIGQKDGVGQGGDVNAASECAGNEGRTSHALDPQQSQRPGRSEDDGKKKESVGRESTADVDDLDDEHRGPKKSDFGRNSDAPNAYEKKPSRLNFYQKAFDTSFFYKLFLTNFISKINNRLINFRTQGKADLSTSAMAEIRLSAADPNGQSRTKSAAFEQLHQPEETAVK